MDRPLSVLDLSKMAEMPYATTHTTLQKLKETRLVVLQSTNEKVLYAVNRADENVRKLFELLFKFVPKEDTQDTKDVTDDDVLWNLAGLGAPLVVENKSQKELPLEKTVALALNVVRRNPTAARALPLVLAENSSRMNYARLRYWAKEAKATRTLGFFLDLTHALQGRSRFKKMANELLDRRVKQNEPFFKTSSTKYAMMLAHRKTPSLARKWHFTMNMSLNDFRSVFEKFYHGPTKI